MKTEIVAPLTDLNSNLWGSCFRIPDEVANQFIEGKDRRVLCTINKKETIHCAIMPSPQGYFIMVNKQVRRKLGLSLGDEAKLSIKKDTSQYGMPVSAEFEAVIFEDEEVKQYFDQLTDGRKRNLIHLVNKIKSADIRINRSMAIAHHLREDRGVIDFKRLNEVIKEYNQRNRL